MPILVLKERRTKMIMARVVLNKGLVHYAWGASKKMIMQLGYKKVLRCSDNEPAILALKDAVRKESDIEAIFGEAPAGDHQANRLIDNTIKKRTWSI